MAQKKKMPAERNVQRLVDDIFSESVREAKEHNAQRGARYQGLTGPVLKRRKEAVLRNIPKIRERYGEQYPDLDLEKIFAEECSSQGMTLNGVDSLYHISLAAALWMLDNLERGFLLWKALPILETDPSEIPFRDLPDCRDARYSDRVIREMVYLIRERDSKTDHCNWYLNPESARREHAESAEKPDGDDVSRWTVRERFRALLDMIHPVYVERAVQRFEEAMWKFYDVVFAAVDCCSRKLTALDQKLDSLTRQREAAGKPDLLPDTGAPSFPFTLPPNFASGAPFSGMKDNLKEIGHMSVQMLKVHSGICDQEDRMYHVLHYAHMLPMDTDDDADFIDPDDLKAIRSIEVDDPYEICFAYLYLVETGSDLPWLYNAPNMVLLMAARKLPWTAFLGDADPDEDLDDWDEDAEEESDDAEDGEDSDPDSIVSREPLDWNHKKAGLYALKYENSILYAPLPSPNSGWKVNLPQIIYGLTGILMPRDVSSCDETKEDFVAAGAEENFAEAMELYTQLASDSGYRMFDHYEEEESNAEEEEPQVSDLIPEERITVLETQLKEAHQNIARLKQSLYESEKALQTTRQEQKEREEKTAGEHKELADLREILYHQANEQEEVPESREEIQFPYQVVHRTVVFGGHDTWSKAIRPMLPNVTFIPRGQLPNAELIRNQERVWIQPNALSHADYYKLLNVVRAHGIPIHYFGYASAKKCAIQLVEEDRQNEDS